MRAVLTMFACTASAYARSALKPIMFGQPATVQILQPQLQSHGEVSGFNLTEKPVAIENQPVVRTFGVSKVIHDRKDDVQEEDLDVGFSSNEDHPQNLFDLHKRTSRNCGVFRLDCSYVGSACNWPNWKDDDPDLQMDEWPVAAMSQPQWASLPAGTVRNSLRCIKGSHNSRAGNSYKWFRQGQKDYNKAGGGKYVNLRLCDGMLKRGDTFTVEFDLSGMSNVEIDEIVPYCKPNLDCTNDGQQLHLSDLNFVTSSGKAGRMGWPYDIEYMNNYKVTGENDPVESFQVVVQVFGDDRDMFAATVSRFRDDKLEQVGDLVITRRSDIDGDRLDFVYGDPSNELSGFAFNSDDAGFSSQFDDNHRYCLIHDLEDNDGDLFGQ
ncbi:hypothetical protein KCU67_g4740, partial [Aureobasidium melanogenum]